MLVLSQYVEPVYTGELLASGESGVGYLLKERVGEVRSFLDAVHRVAAGGTALDREVIASLVRAQTGGGDDPLEQLTPRERETLSLIAQGRTNAAIARELVITLGAVEKHVTNIFGKLNLPATDDDHRRVLAVLAYLGAGGPGIADQPRRVSGRSRERPLKSPHEPGGAQHRDGRRPMRGVRRPADRVRARVGTRVRRAGPVRDPRGRG